MQIIAVRTKCNIIKYDPNTNHVTSGISDNAEALGKGWILNNVEVATLFRVGFKIQKDLQQLLEFLIIHSQSDFFESRQAQREIM